MVNIRLGSFDDFIKAIQNAPQSVKNILYKAYPEYARQLQDIYSKVINNQQSISTNQKPQPQVTGSTPKMIGTTAAKEAGKATMKATPLLKGLGKVASKVAPVTAVAAEVPQLLDPNDPVKNKVLSLGGIAGILTGHPWLGLTALAGAGLNRTANPTANAIGDIAYNNWNKKFGTDSSEYDPNFIKLTPEQTQAGYGNKQDVTSLAKDINTLNQLEQDVANEQELTNIAEGNYNTALQNYQNVIAAMNPNAQQQVTYNSTGVPQTQLFPNGLNTDVPVVQEGGVPTQYIQGDQQTNQQALTPQQTASPVSSDNLRQASIQNLDTLNNMENNNQQQAYDITQYTPFLQQYADLAAQQRLQQQAQNEAILNQYADIMNRYQEAINKDRQYQALQSMADSFSGIDSGYQGPVQFIGPQGQMYTIGNQQAQQNALLRQTRAQQNATPNADMFKNMLALEQLKLKDPRLQTPQDNAMQKLMEAQLLGQTFKVNPALFLGGNAEKIIDILGKDRNEITKTEGTRSLLGSQALKEITVDQANTANQMVRDKALADNNMLNTAYVQGKLDQRQYNELMARQAQFNAQLEADMNLLKQRGAQEKDLIDYRINAESKNPINAIKYGMQYQGNAGYFPSGQDASNAFQTGINYYNTIMGINNPIPTPTVLDSQSNGFTPQQIENMMKFRRN